MQAHAILDDLAGAKVEKKCYGMRAKMLRCVRHEGTYHVRLIGCASVLKTTRLKLSVSGGAKMR